MRTLASHDSGELGRLATLRAQILAEIAAAQLQVSAALAQQRELERSAPLADFLAEAGRQQTLDHLDSALDMERVRQIEREASLRHVDAELHALRSMRADLERKAERCRTVVQALTAAEPQVRAASAVIETLVTQIRYVLPQAARELDQAGATIRYQLQHLGNQRGHLEEFERRLILLGSEGLDK